MYIYFNERKQIIQIDGVASDEEFARITIASISLNMPACIRRGPTQVVITSRKGEEQSNLLKLKEILL